MLNLAVITIIVLVAILAFAIGFVSGCAFAINELEN